MVGVQDRVVLAGPLVEHEADSSSREDVAELAQSSCDVPKDDLVRFVAYMSPDDLRLPGIVS